MKTNFRLIGDVHGYYDQYHQLLRKADNTFQIGDFGFIYDTLNGVDSRRHKILAGNHDNYDDMCNWPHFLGNHGVHTVSGFGDIFFVRGALSIDKHMRTQGFSWWEEEELTIAQGMDVLDAYKEIKPTFVVTHSCPATVIPHVTVSLQIFPSRTSQLLEAMFAIHKPEKWVFGHFHRSWNQIIDGTHFICLDELECLDF